MVRVKAIFLDRDGTLNYDPGYVHRVEDFKLLKGVIKGLKLLKKEGYIFIIITNQSGIGRGYYTIEDFHKFNSILLNTLKKQGLEIKKIYFCPHHPDEQCDCRKPNQKNMLLAKNEFNIDVENSWMLGDHPSDIQFGINAGCRTIYLSTGHGILHFEELKEKGIYPNFIADDFLTAVDYILKNSH